MIGKKTQEHDKNIFSIARTQQEIKKGKKNSKWLRWFSLWCTRFFLFRLLGTRKISLNKLITKLLTLKEILLLLKRKRTNA